MNHAYLCGDRYKKNLRNSWLNVLTMDSYGASVRFHQAKHVYGLYYLQNLHVDILFLSYHKEASAHDSWNLTWRVDRVNSKFFIFCLFFNFYTECLPSQWKKPPLANSSKARREQIWQVPLCKNLTIRRPNIVRRVLIILHSPLSTNLTK